jgi:hypothetical protein
MEQRWTFVAQSYTKVARCNHGLKIARQFRRQFHSCEAAANYHEMLG